MTTTIHLMVLPHDDRPPAESVAPSVDIIADMCSRHGYPIDGVTVNKMRGLMSVPAFRRVEISDNFADYILEQNPPR